MIKIQKGDTVKVNNKDNIVLHNRTGVVASVLENDTIKVQFPTGKDELTRLRLIKEIGNVSTLCAYIHSSELRAV